MRSVRLLLSCAFLLCAMSLHAARSRQVSADVTVLLFRTESVQQVHIQSSGAVLQLCPNCAQRAGPVALDLRREGSAMIDGANHVMHAVSVDGSVTIETAEHRRAQVAGRWRIDGDGNHLQVRVQIPRERYVEAVLASEAAPDEPPASLRALAIVARSFVAATAKRHADGAFCDTTHCQALRLEPVRQAVRDAVWSTSGETLWWGGKQVPAYFSQHCGGFTEEASFVWGGRPLPWLAAHADAWCARVPSQWHASLREADVRRAMQIEGISVPDAIAQIVPLNRDPSGRVQKLKLRFARSTQTIDAATFRFAINRSLGWNQIRSDRYQVQRVGDRFVLQGSGYGHGVGLCQAGAAEMARARKSEREILQMYFSGATVRMQARDSGWIEVRANGFTLRTAGRNAALEAAAASAFADARARWGRPVTVNPTVTIFPTTEAFRQATGQAGWTLATTQGSSIAVQPPAVLEPNGGARPLLRHEFLHSFVESEASPTAPLWLREGLVAVLNAEPCADASHPTSADQVDTALRGASSLAQSQQAHRTACSLTQRYVQLHGIDAVHRVLEQR